LAGPAELLDRIWDTALLTGAVLGPFDAWLLLRGLRTLPLRMPRHNANGRALGRARVSQNTETQGHPTVRGLSGRSPSMRTLLTGGTVVSMDPALGDLDSGDVLIEDGVTVFPIADPVATIVSAGHPGLVDTVLVAGRAVKRDGVLLDVDLPALRARLTESRDRIAAAAGVRLDGSWRPAAQAK
jgi:hypothetical protein